MKFNYLLILTLLLGVHFNSYAKFAKVVSIRGKVSQLPPGAIQASWVKKGQLIKEDTSIVTRVRSFVKVQILEDGSYITVGPNTKIKIAKIEKKSGSIIQLLNGKMRAKIRPQDKKVKGHKAFNKVYIKTKTMALGVRGTEFITVASQKNKATSVITLEGEVAVKKINEERVDIEETVKESLDRDDVTLVKKGSASTTYDHLYDETPAQKVNPNQLIALEKNETLETVSAKEIQKAPEAKLNETQVSYLYGKDTKVDEIPNNGAIVDLDSAIFIPEIKDESLKVGDIDKNTGQFIAANNVKLDEKKGFVAANEKDEQAKEVAKKLNEKIEYREVKGHEVVDHGTPLSRTSYLTNMHNSWSASFGMGARRMGYYSMDNNDNKSNYVGAGITAAVYYQQVFNKRLYARYKIGVDSIYMFRDDQRPENKDDDFISPELAADIYYRLNSELRFKVGYHLQDEFFLTGRFETSLTPVLDQRTQFIPYMTFGVAYDYSDNWTYLIDYRSYMPSSDRPNINVYTGKGFEIGARRKLSSTTALLFNLIHREFLAQDIKVKNLDLNVNYEMEF
ncbi:sigma factor regulatory protein, FecR/PupR family [Halobacteriovorax sp. BALOs_7]|uniref:FecR family protein n=1 Tax=Halobacteriovorax sp. BALOs_7 TaxID=2109558 RepID=UPI000EA2425D|nr:FecR family protein [Halobacteriovorax sp. BALOs_7]AYF44431.1 sigma factor regulatory protein, FecR/PupR family [Halobacteriovorax sp. BALOs_7]